MTLPSRYTGSEDEKWLPRNGSKRKETRVKVLSTEKIPGWGFTFGSQKMGWKEKSDIPFREFQGMVFN